MFPTLVKRCELWTSLNTFIQLPDFSSFFWRNVNDVFRTIDFAFDGDEAIAQLEKNSYDLALIDIHMPGHTGLEVATMAREQLNIRFPLIALTAGVLDEEQQACYDAGMDGFLRKPIRLDELRAALIQQLERTAA